jgi:hypothetical protein
VQAGLPRRQRERSHVGRLWLERERDVALHELAQLGAHQLAPPSGEQRVLVLPVRHGFDEALQLGSRRHELGGDVSAVAACADEHGSERGGGRDAPGEAWRKLAGCAGRLCVRRPGEGIEQPLCGRGREAPETAQPPQCRGILRIAPGNLDNARVLEDPAGRQVAGARLLLAPGRNRAERDELPAAQPAAPRDLEVRPLRIGLDRRVGRASATAKR